MKKFFSLLLVLLLSLLTHSLSVFAQNINKANSLKDKSYSFNSCGVINDPNIWKKDKYYLKNNELVQNLRKHKVAIDSNYLEKLETNDASTMMSPSMFTTESTQYLLPIKAWIYHEDNGTGSITRAELNQIIERINQLYRPYTQIQFYLLCDITDVNSSNFAHSSTADFNDYAANNKTPGAINVHFVIESLEWNGIATLPWDNPNSACAVANNSSPIVDEANSLAHEIGHVLGLLHTHNPGRSNDQKNEDCGDCYQEAVSRSKKQGLACVSTIGAKKCEVNGDFLCDTQADPALRWNGRTPHESYLNGCTYDASVGGTDRWGDQWQPLVVNLMSYATRDCRYYFTPLQVSKMYANISSLNLLPRPFFNISGPDQLCVGQTAQYTVNALPGSPTYTWALPWGITILSGQGTNTIDVVSNIDWGGLMTVTPDCGQLQASFLIKNLSYISISGPDNACPNQGATYEATYIPGATYNWTISDGYIAWQGGNVVDVYFYYSPNHYTTLDVSTVSPCNSSQTLNTTIYIQQDPNCSMYAAQAANALDSTTADKAIQSPEALLSGKPLNTRDITIFPNPAKTTVKIIAADNEVYDLIVINALGQTIYKRNKVQQQLDLDVQHYENGLYFIYLIGKERTYSKKLVITK